MRQQSFAVSSQLSSGFQSVGLSKFGRRDDIRRYESMGSMFEAGMNPQIQRQVDEMSYQGSAFTFQATQNIGRQQKIKSTEQLLKVLLGCSNIQISDGTNSYRVAKSVIKEVIDKFNVPSEQRAKTRKDFSYESSDSEPILVGSNSTM